MFISCALLTVALLAAEPAAPTRSTWEGFDRLDFQVDSGPCLLVLPKTPAGGKPWIWRMEFFGHEPQADLALLGRGFHVAYTDVQNLYGLTDDQARAYRLNPVDNLAPLAAAHIPILSVCGDADDVVPLAENTGLVQTRYQTLGGPITVIVKPGIGHHPHSLQDPTRIVDFVLRATAPGR